MAGNSLRLALVRADAWKTLNGLDAERFPNHHGDLDFAVRATAAGLIHLCTSAVAAADLSDVATAEHIDAVSLNFLTPQRWQDLFSLGRGPERTALMKICVIAPSEQYLAAAGVRIRYQRIAKHLATLGHELRIAVVDTLNKASALTDDVYLISKCYDARALVVARLLADNGKIIGADFFDDYFSQAGDSRFVRQREWVRDLAGFLDFFLCSTPRMREVIAGYLGDRAGHIMNDPFNSFDIDATRARLETNLDNALTRRRIDVLWFGVGDNPHFSVGLDDLSGYGHVLGDLAEGRLDVRLSILTNARALRVDGLERLRRLPVPYRVEEWTEEKETDHLARSLVAFLPVNAQPFSAAKSLNRAVSALTSGVQVLSPGYPLYAPLGRFVYDDAGRLRQDLEAGALALRGETLPGLMDLFTTWGDPQREADKLATFLETVRTAKRPVAPPQTPTVVGVVNGKRGAVEAHKYAQRTGHLSIASPSASTASTTTSSSCPARARTWTSGCRRPPPSAWIPSLRRWPGPASCATASPPGWCR